MRDGVRPPFIFYGQVVMPNVIKEMNCGCALLSQVRMHTATAKIKQPMHWNGLLFGRMPKFERGRL
jgi:hypothetical protein